MEKTHATKIADLLRKQIEKFDPKLLTSQIGTVRDVGDGIVSITGLSQAKAMEMLRFESGVLGVALNLEEERVGAMVLGDTQGIRAGQTVESTGRILSIPVSDGLVGRVITPLGEAMDGKGDLKSKETYPIERVAPGVMSREPVSVPLMTGIKAVDAMIPIGRGQRELIIGDRQVGKTALAIDTIINQKGKDVVCIYVAIGQKESKIAKIVSRLEKHDAMAYTVIVLAGASAPASLQYLAPYAGCAVGEYFMDKGKDVLIVYDDLSKHAWAYREISLLLRRPPGREAYPGDIFYSHSRLLERACRRNADSGGGSITALPIIETQAGDVSAYIPTNVISITDGQIYLEGDLFYKGIRPAVNVGLSVSRVGGAAQTKAMKKVSGQLRLDLAQFRELEAFAQFATDLDETTRKQIERGRRTVEALKQPQYEPMDMAVQVALLYAVTRGHLDTIPVEKIKEWEDGYREFLRTAPPEWLEKLNKAGLLEPEIEEAMKESISEFTDTFNAAS
ncbi:MAG: F0F1 ATP synthase subunit alpha [Patescibacteria group bacterium]